MLKLEVPGSETFDERTNEFVTTPPFRLELEHSLVSLSKWEAFHHKPFLGPGSKTPEETLSYIYMMTLTPEVPEEVFVNLATNHELVKKINAYIEDSQTATWFAEDPNRRGGPQEIVTAEIIYWWLSALNLPFECQEWPLNRLFTLVRVTNEKNNPKKQKKMSQSEIAARNARINAERQEKYGTRG